MTLIRSLLVANRGEIALRIMRTARRLGIRVIAVYSDADAQAPHVLFADDAVRIGPGPAADSYLLAERILDAARTSGADAIHPGYGFLSENATFARKVQEVGLIFVGPPADAIDAMGDKAESKRRMIAAGVPCVPGYEGTDQSNDKFLAAALEIGFPVMVKASAGGGGRGMRLVNSLEELETGLRLARSEGLSAFGSDILILEKAILQPRHIEIQIFADRAGNTVHMGERDCSVQRRHQKVIEESPSPAVTPELRKAMGQAAIEAARAIKYVGAGTVEFLTDTSGGFYFLEMNTRLQVEHPVTEMVTGLDLVALQIEVAQGSPLDMTQEDITLSGHAIEARLYAEDPSQDFQPATGRIALWSPASGEGLRVDDGITSGQLVSPFYDPMLAKVIAWGENREIARRRLIAALKGSPLLGVTSNKRFLTQILERPAFAEGRATTAFIAEEFTQYDLAAPSADAHALAVAAVLFYRGECDAALAASPGISTTLLNWSSAGNMHSMIELRHAEQKLAAKVKPHGAKCYAVEVGENEVAITFNDASIKINGRNSGVFWVRENNNLYLELDGHNHSFTLLSRLAAEDSVGSAGDVRAPMHGVLTELHARLGQNVQAGDRLAVLEAMKLQHEIRAEIAGSVSAIMATTGNQIGAGELILEIEAEDGND